MKLLLYGVALLALLSACDWRPPPTDCRTTGCEPGLVCEEKDGTWRCVPAPPVDPPASMLLRNSGDGRFADLDGVLVDMLAEIPCCAPVTTAEGRRPSTIMAADDTPVLTGWPIAIDPAFTAWAEKKTAGKVNFYHARLGPFFADATAEPEWMDTGGAYVRVEGKADLTRFNPAFWDRVYDWAHAAGMGGSWIEVDVIDRWWYKQRTRPHPMRPQWNLQGYDFNVGRGVFEPGSFRDAWLRQLMCRPGKPEKALGRLSNMIWEDGNEVGLGGYDAAYTFSMRERMRFHGAACGAPVHLFGTNANKTAAEVGPVDYVSRHQGNPIPSPIAGKPSYVNEYNPRPPFTPAAVLAKFCSAKRNRTYFAHWFHEQTQPQIEETMRLLAGGCDAAPPQDCEVPVHNHPSWGDRYQGRSGFGEAIIQIRQELGDVCGNDPNDTLLEVAKRLRARGYCASAPWPDAVGVGVLNQDVEEWHLVSYGNGCWTGNSFKGIWDWPAGVPWPGQAGECGAPTPPPLHHFRGPAEKPCSGSQCCDATPYVCDQAYCRAVGFTDGRRCCAVRAEGFEDREACEHLVLSGDAVWTSSTGAIERCNENHLRAKCPRGCAWLQVCDASGTICNRKTF